MSKIRDITEAKINVYKNLIVECNQNIQDYRSTLEKQTFVDKQNYPLIYNTLEKYVMIMNNAHAQGNATEEQVLSVQQHMTNLKNLFVEHQSNLQTSLHAIKGKLQATDAHKRKLQELLAKEEKYLHHILNGDIDDTGAYIGKIEKRPAGIRPADPLSYRKQNK